MRYYDTRPQARRAAKAPVVAQKTETPLPPRITSIAFDKEPLWAYGFIDQAKPTDKAQPQAPPTSKPRPNQDLNEQMRPRKVEGSSAAYNLVQIRNLHDVIDWFPGD